MSDVVVIFDHAPRPGPMYWDFRCLDCGKLVDIHGSWLARWQWRRAQRKARR